MTNAIAPRPTNIPLNVITKVTFYKRDEITTDLICCDVGVGSETLFYHEEDASWALLIEHLQNLPDFRNDWFASVSQPPFVASETVAFSR